MAEGYIHAGISSFAAGIGRLGDFVEAMEKSQQKQEYLRREEHSVVSLALKDWGVKSGFEGAKVGLRQPGLLCLSVWFWEYDLAVS